MASFKAVLMLLIIAAAMQSGVVQSQDCAAGLGQLASCTPFVVPGMANGPPSSQCCASLNSLDHGCLCNTIDIINRLPASCNLPPLSCAA